jgi:hypothetical protein
MMFMFRHRQCPHICGDFWRTFEDTTPFEPDGPRVTDGGLAHSGFASDQTVVERGDLSWICRPTISGQGGEDDRLGDGGPMNQGGRNGIAGGIDVVYWKRRCPPDNVMQP